MNILITGGTGLVGSRLTELLQAKGHQISYLSRNSKSLSNIKVYQWNVNKGNIELESIEKADCIINLAGAGVADKMWTAEYKKELRDSRILGTQLLMNTLKTTKNNVKTFIQASAIGIYGLDTKDNWLLEDAQPGTDFLATLTKDWEQEANLVEKLGIRMVKLRIGIVLSKKGGALTKLALPVKFFAGAAIGSGQQYLSWIHIDDLCKMFIQAIENQNMNGVYNAAAPNPVTNEEMTKAIAKVLDKPLFLPNVPAFVLKIGMGEMSDIVLGGNRVSVDKIVKAGFQFDFSNLDNTLKNLLIT
jgi:uncharacterized protein (TIGR01777 family)